MQRLIRENPRMDRMRRHGRFRKALQNELQLAGIGRNIANGVNTRDAGFKRCGCDADVAAFKAKAPMRNRAEFHGKPEKRQQMIRRHIAGFTLQGRQHHRFQPRAIALEAVQLIGDGHFHFATRGGRCDLSG